MAKGLNTVSAEKSGLKIPHIDFVGNRKKFFIFSLSIIAVVLVITVIFGVNFAIEFKGGTLVQYTYSGEVDLNTFKSDAQKALGGMAVNVRQGEDFSSGKKTLQVSLVSDQGLTADKQFELTNTLQESYTANELELLNSSDVNPATGKEFFQKCLVAVALAIVVLILYIAWRFKRISGWAAGAMAVVALLHDVFMVFGVFVIGRLAIDANFMAVVLTILGYSINDTIVIYDRIRENEHTYRGTISRAELVNLSINQSLTRSIYTSVSTVLAMIVVCIVGVVFGISSIISFALPMIIGMIFGTYSTICIAGPLWVWWEERKAGKKGGKVGGKAKAAAK